MLPSHEMRDHNYPSIGYCIFCLDKELPPRQLSEEHIIPYGLNGRLRFKDAACTICAAAGNKLFEQPVLNTDLLIPRLLLGLRRRNKKSPKTFPRVAIGDQVMSGDTESFDRQLNQGNYPKRLTFLKYVQAGIWEGKMNETDIQSMQIFFRDLSTYYPHERIADITTREMYTCGVFGRAVIKMAYCFAVAELGIDSFNGTEIRRVISGENHNVFTYFGSLLNPHRSHHSELHRISIKKKQGYLTVIVHLFSSYKVPPYEVVLAKL